MNLKLAIALVHNRYAQQLGSKKKMMSVPLIFGFLKTAREPVIPGIISLKNC